MISELPFGRPVNEVHCGTKIQGFPAAPGTSGPERFVLIFQDQQVVADQVIFLRWILLVAMQCHVVWGAEN